MRILILNWRDLRHPLAGGAEISTHEHAKNWAKAGNEIIQFSSSFKGAKKKEVIDGIKIIRRGNHYTVHLWAFIYYLCVLRGKIDLIVDEFHFIPFFSPIYSKCKKLVFIHETAKELWFKNQFFPINILGFFLEPFFFKLYRNTCFMTVSKSTKKDLIEFGILPKNINIIHNGIEKTESKEEKEKKPTVIYLGRLAKDKGTEDALLSLKKLIYFFPNVNLWIVGREEKKGYLKKLQKKAESFRIEKNVTFFNFVSQEKKFDLLKRAWVLVHPSVKEGWGLTIIEAASQGTPSVSYDILGLRDSIIEGKTGLLVKNKNPEGLAEKINVLFNDKLLYNQMSNSAVLWSKNFSWKKSTQESLNLINKII